MKKLVYEFIGTFFLVFIIGCAVSSGSTMPALAIGAALMALVYAGGHISGAHYNPAVSLAIFLRKKMQMNEMLQYWAVQIIGGFLGAYMACYIGGYNHAATCSMAPGEGVPAMVALMAEILGTFALAFVVLNVATVKANEGNSFYGIAIGLVVFAMAVSLGGVSGGAFNPAVGIGRNLCEAISTGSGLANTWIYIVGPFIGGAIAAFVFNYCNDVKE